MHIANIPDHVTKHQERILEQIKRKQNENASPLGSKLADVVFLKRDPESAETEGEDSVDDDEGGDEAYHVEEADESNEKVGDIEAEEH